MNTDLPAVIEKPALPVVVEPLQPPALFSGSTPLAIITHATQAADALKLVIKKQGLISVISGKEYPRCEAWTLLGTIVGVFPVLCWSRPVEKGWEARVEARTLAGAIVGAAEAECLRSERNWANRDDFALRSMAQTRATAKALRMPLGFVMTLAGYEPTPAEEMSSEQGRRTPPAKDYLLTGKDAAPKKPLPAKDEPQEAIAQIVDVQEKKWQKDGKDKTAWLIKFNDGFSDLEAWCHSKSTAELAQTAAGTQESFKTIYQTIPTKPGSFKLISIEPHKAGEPKREPPAEDGEMPLEFRA